MIGTSTLATRGRTLRGFVVVVVASAAAIGIFSRWLQTH